MSRAVRRSTRGSARARARRTPVRPSGESRFNIPWVPIVVFIAAVGIAGLIGYLIWQQSKPAKNHFDEAARLEADPAPDLPGVYVDLPKIYGGFYGNSDGPNTAEHVTRDVNYATDCTTTTPKVCNSNPPVGGPHWGSRACPEDPDDAPAFCGPAPWGVYRKPWQPGSLVHNMEHSGIVIWYNTTNQQVIDELESLAKSDLKNKHLLVLTPYPDMEPETIAVTTWGRIDKFPVSQYSKDRVTTFIRKLRCRFNPENFSGAGC